MTISSEDLEETLWWVSWMFKVQWHVNAKLKKQCWSSRRPTTGSGQTQCALILGQSSGLEGENHYVMIEHWKELVLEWKVGQPVSMVSNQPASVSIHHLLLLCPWVSMPFSLVALFCTRHPLRQSGSEETSGHQISSTLSQVKDTLISTRDRDSDDSNFDTDTLILFQLLN